MNKKTEIVNYELDPDPETAANLVKPKLDEISSSMCMAKWLWTSVHLTNGTTNSCFLPPIHKIEVENIIDNPKGLHNTPQKKEQRAMMLKGEQPDGCSYCWNIEKMDRSFNSDRHYRSSEPWAQAGWDDVVAGGADVDIEPRFMEVNFNHACNLACSYCSPHLSSAWAKDIEENGPYDTIIPHNSIDYFKQIGQYPIPNREVNPYVDAFWEWWPELYPKLQNFRMTGGEPLMDKNTFRVLDYVIENGRPDLEMAVTTNASVPDKLWNKFVDKVSFISEYNKLKRFRAFVSVDGWGDQAEYMRHGLDFDKMWNNVNNYLTRVDEGLVTFIVTFNMLSLPSIKKLLEGILELQRIHNVTKSRRDDDGNIVVYGHHKVFIDTPMLRYPEWQSLQLAPKEHWHYADEALEFMKANQDKHRESRWVGFKPHQIERFDRSIEFMKQGFDSDKKRQEAEENFVRFFDDHDRRRNTSILDTFPEFSTQYHEWKDKYDV
jgi:organic radical activating enzyme